MTIFYIENIHYLIGIWHRNYNIYETDAHINDLAQGQDFVINLVDISNQQAPIDSYLNQICNIY